MGFRAPSGRTGDAQSAGRGLAAAMTPDLADLLAALAKLPANQLPEAIGQLEAAKAAAWARLVLPARQAHVVPNGDGALLDVKEAAAQLGVSTAYLYREVRAHRLPFARRMGRRLRFDPVAMARWIRRHPAG